MRRGTPVSVTPIIPRRSVQLLRRDADVLLPRGLLLVVLLDPRLPALAGGGVAAGEGELGDVGVADAHLLVLVLRDQPDNGIIERLAGAAIEEVTLAGVAVLERDRHIAAV